MKFHPASHLRMRDFYFKIFWMQIEPDLSLRSENSMLKLRNKDEPRSSKG